LTTSTSLINHKQYYYMAVAYGYNQYKPYQPDSIDKGQATPYLQGRNNIQLYTGIPHIPVGSIMNSNVGDGPVITRIQGQGNGGMTIEFSDKKIAEILAKPIADSLTNVYGSPDYPISYHPEYLVSQGPLNVKVVDPLNVVSGKFIVKFDSMVAGPSNSPFTDAKIKFGHWKLYNESNGLTYNSDTTTIYPYESLFLNIGLALTINQVPYANDTAKDGTHYTSNGLLSAPAAIYADSTKMWLGGVADNDVPDSPQNWIRSGTYKGANASFADWNMPANQPWDPNQDVIVPTTNYLPFWKLFDYAAQPRPKSPCLKHVKRPARHNPDVGITLQLVERVRPVDPAKRVVRFQLYDGGGARYRDGRHISATARTKARSGSNAGWPRSMSRGCFSAARPS